MHWRRTAASAFLVVVTMSLVASRARAEDPIMVPTTVMGSVTDFSGQPPDPHQGIQLQLVQFAGKSWNRQYWATIVCTTAGTINTVTAFPVTPSTVQKILGAAKGKTSLLVPMTFRVLDHDGQPTRLNRGLVIRLDQIGRDPWPDGSVIIIRGKPDDMGYIWANVSFPVNQITLNNLVLMAHGQGRRSQ